MDSREFMKQLWRYKRGSIARRQFMGATGLGLATAVMAKAMPDVVGPRPARAAGIGDLVSLASWPNYHDLKNFEEFTKQTGAKVKMDAFGSNEEMLAKLQAGGTGWDAFVPTNYTITTYVELDLIEPLELAKIPNFDAAQFDPRFSAAGPGGGMGYAGPEGWGTNGSA